jgi:carboxymethylenebutenolidase
MGQMIRLTASDGFELGAYRADAPGTPKGAVVVLQEIFGVNANIRTVCDRFTQQGYTAIAPALFDRTKPGFESGYSPEEVTVARSFIAKPDIDAFLRDTQAAINAVAPVGPVGVLGFCLGGSLAFLAATRLTGLSAAVGYYGGMIARFADEVPKVPVLLHFGETDGSIPLSDVEIVRARRPEVETHVYAGAGHGFGNDARPSYHPDSAQLARQRSLDFLARHLAR